MLVYYKHKIILKSNRETVGLFKSVLSESDQCCHQKAFASLVETVGSNILDDGWGTRATILESVSDKVFLLELNKDEYERIYECDKLMDEWTEAKDMSQITGRMDKVEKTCDGLVGVNKNDFLDYIDRFTLCKPREERVSDAELFGKVTSLFYSTRLSKNEYFKKPLDGSDLAFLESHVEKL